MVERCSSQREKWGVIDMLEITDRFKAWMRGRLADHSYAECIFQALIDEEDATLLEVWPHAALPMKSTLDDPDPGSRKSRYSIVTLSGFAPGTND